MKDFVYQINNNECGFASLKMLLSIVLKDSSYLYLSNSGVKEHQYSLLELKEIARSKGVLLAGYLINNQHDLLHLKTPFIYIRSLANGNKHAVVVKKIFKSFALIYDPAIGKKLVKANKYFVINENVEVLTVESFSVTSSKEFIKPLIENKDLTKIFAFEVFAIISYFLSAYFLGKEFSVVIPLTFMLLGIIFALIYKINSFKVMKKFDEEYIPFTYDLDKNKREINYRLLHETKSGLLSTSSNIIITFSSSLLINIILVMQNKSAIFIILSSSILVLIDALFINEKIKNKSYRLEELEKNTLSKDNLSKDEYLNNYEEIKESTYHIARIVDFKRLIMYSILLIICVIFSCLTNNTDFYFVVFHFAMCMFTYVSLDNVYHMLEKSKENQINQVKFYNLINEKDKK